MNIDDIKPYAKNAKKHEKKQIQQVANSIKRFGFVQPIVIDKNNEVVIGHCRLEAAKLLELTDVPTISVENLSDKEVKALRLADNKLNESAWDMDLVIEDLKGLNNDLLDLTGFDKDVIIDVKEDEFDAQAEYDKITQPRAELGQLWALGEHRLLCGDSTKAESYEKLMGGVLADMVFTDPPYNINYHSLGGQSYNEGKYEGANKKGVFSDNKTPKEYLDFLKKVIGNCIKFSQENIAIFLWNGDRNLDIAIKACKDNKCSINELAVWVKNGFVWSPGCVFHKALEFCIIAFKNGHKPKINKQYAKFQDNIFDLEFNDFADRLQFWFVKRDALMSYKHPTQKPIRLTEPALRACTELNNIVLDVFNGSGSTMMACEQLGRKCFAIELDPKYVDVAIKRWELATDKKAVKL